MVGRTPITGMWKTQKTFDPSELTQSETRLLSPLMTDEMVITVVTPITMPRMVNPERSLLARRVSRAILMDSRVCPCATCRASPNFCLFVPQSFDGVQRRGLPGWINPKQQPD